MMVLPFLKWLDKHFEESVMCVILMVMTVIMGFQVFARYALNASLTWSEEITRYLFVWCGFMSIALCIRYRLALKVDQLLNMLPPKAKTALRVAASLVELALFAYLTPFAYTLARTAFRSGRLSPAAQIPIWLVQAAPFTGFVLGTVRSLQAVALTVLEGRADQAGKTGKKEAAK